MLNTGITVAGRPFQFLAFSSSQLKEQSVWMVACGPKETKVRFLLQPGVQLATCFSLGFSVPNVMGLLLFFALVLYRLELV